MYAIIDPTTRTTTDTTTLTNARAVTDRALVGLWLVDTDGRLRLTWAVDTSTTRPADDPPTALARSA